MRRNLAELAEREFDVVIIGGGVAGACIAWDATLRGLSVALLERGDFGARASANFLKLVHGGIRYLQHLDIPRLRASVAERTTLLRIAPHLVEPLPFAMPTYGRHGERTVLAAGLRAYDLLSAGRNRGLDDATRRLPRGRLLSSDEARELLPEVDPEGLSGAGIFYDGLIYNPARLTLGFLAGAAERGARVANYVEATELLRDDGRVRGVRAAGVPEGDSFEVRARMVVNATGGWAPGLLSREGLADETPPTFSRDACLILRRELAGGHAIALRTGTRDPDAIISRGARHLFLVPWRDTTLVGVWHKVHRGDPSAYGISDGELDRFLDDVNDLGLRFEVTRDDVSRTCCGLVLFGSRQPDGGNLSYGKRSLLVDHEERDGVPGLLTAVVVRYTVGRRLAERVVDRILERLGREAGPCATRDTPLPGGDVRMDELEREIAAGAPAALPARAAAALMRNHGGRWRAALEPAASDPALLETLGDSAVTGAEVLYAAREEAVVTLEDAVCRRTELGSAGYPGRDALRRAAELVAGELGWSRARMEQEVDAVTCGYPTQTSAIWTAVSCES